jgi:hypothetical protein
VVGGLDGEVVRRRLPPPVQPLDRTEAVEREDEVPARTVDGLVVGVRRDRDAAELGDLREDLAHLPRRRGAEDLRWRRDRRRIREEAEVVAAVGRDLDAAQGDEALLPPRRADLLEPVERVEVRERDAVEAERLRPADHVPRRERAVAGVMAVNVQIDEHGAPPPGWTEGA